MALALVYAVTAAILLGSSDFFAARSARTVPSVTVTRTVVGVSTALSPLLLLAVDSQWIARDALIGALSGVAMTSGLLLLYRGYAVARMGVVAPMSSVLLAAVPVVVDLVRGDRPSTLGAVGMGVGLVALVLTSYHPGGTGSVSLGALLGIGSGVLFGIAFTLMGEVSEAAGLMPVLVQRLTGFTILTIAFPFASLPFIARGVGRRPAMVAGGFAVFAIAALQLGFQKGDSGPVSVAASQFATVAVVLSVMFNGERMRWWQATGVAATAVGVSLMALGT
ncbi:MAG: EamA family transporter [Ilumatobacteraceae bacterium]|nr:EamA family transporter [Ilumatobacteraceae bacterium]